jgi:CheY-like chemotaxis protein
MPIEFANVLVADDDADDREFFRAGMSRIYPQANVLTFENGEKLLEYLGDPKLADLPGLILLDYKMPPLNAPDILQEMEAAPRYTQIPKIVWSTSQLQQEIDECLSLGAVRFTVKPIADDQLDNFIRSLGCWIESSFIIPSAAKNYG